MNKISTRTEGRNNFDCIILNPSIIDGTGSPEYTSDVGIVGDRVVAISELKNMRPIMLSMPPVFVWLQAL